ncbi:peptidase inhibitor family I36 protein [Streptomyces mirabilis]|uniref:peptidase inhibitor family I36 protein n=1 Tax=Streptomyces mirabilis TaxID=68239 RepID=UPI00369D50D5
MSRTRTIMIAGAAMAAALTLGACSGEGNNNASDGRKSSEISIKDGSESMARGAAPVDTCTQAETVCLYGDVDYKKGLLMPGKGCFDDLRKILMANDSVSSVVNNSSKNIRLYENVGRSGRYIQIDAGSWWQDLRSNEIKVFNNDGSPADGTGGFNDVISSVAGCDE